MRKFVVSEPYSTNLPRVTSSVEERVAARSESRLGVSRAWLLAMGSIVLLFGVAFGPTIAALVRFWAGNDTYHYGFLVPAIAGLLIWLRRGEVHDLSATGGAWTGAALTLAGLLMLTVGRLSGTNLLEALSLVCTVWGLALLLFGWRVTRALTFPLAFLLAMVPFWDLLTGRLQPYFQQYSAAMAVAVLQLFGMPVRQDGVYIELPRITLEVAQACSGINYLTSVLCLGIPLATLFVKRWPKRIFIVLAAMGIALLSNGLRVAMVSVFAYYDLRGENGDIHGPYALFRSLLVSGVGFVALFALIGRFADQSVGTGTSANHRIAPAWARVRALPFLAAIALLGGAVAFGWQHRVEDVLLRADLRTFPPRVGDWEAVPGSFPTDLDESQFDERLSRNYRTSDGRELNLFVGYYRRQAQGHELAGEHIRTMLSRHGSPGLHLPASVTVNDFTSQKAGETFYNAYWYSLNGTVVARDYEEKLLSAWTSIRYRRSNGALIAVKALVHRDEPIEVARARVQEFVTAFMPISETYLPR